MDSLVDLKVNIDVRTESPATHPILLSSSLWPGLSPASWDRVSAFRTTGR